MSDKAISGPELKTTLTGLGLTPKWFAGYLNISMRTVVRWLDQERIPEYAAKELELIHAVTRTEMIDVLTRGISSGVLRTFRRNSDVTSDHGLPAEYSLPASWHRALTFRAVEELRARGDKITVDYWTAAKSKGESA